MSKGTPHLITHNGETHSISEWARRLNIPRPTLADRVRRNIQRGIRPEQALEPEAESEALSKPLPEGMEFDLREWRRPRGWTAEEAGEYLGLSQAMMSMHENGRRPLSDLTKRLMVYIDQFGPLRNSDLPESISAWRTKHGWGPVEAAKRLGIGYTALWKHERLGRRERQLQRLMAYIDMELASRIPTG